MTCENLKLRQAATTSTPVSVCDCLTLCPALNTNPACSSPEDPALGVSRVAFADIEKILGWDDEMPSDLRG